ncbi:MAG TPA: glycosyltransferase family 2 protein [Acidimicrobiales bacterium]|jgi:GT2 family glycosyltransferase|nr:glycosyltransferase family 2 protein [Acidimicrobiales bacterium]
MDPQPSAPPVVVVVVSTDPGDWFEECLASIAAQEYPNLSVLVVDTASAVDPTPRVAAVLPRAYVRRLSERVGFGRAANEVLDIVEGASLYLFCHDDVALEPDATRVLVEEAFRSNAGITGPKVVQWEEPARLLAVGAGVDKVGVVHPLVEPGELDQEQHDAVRDVFVVPSGATLVRADLFAALGGFDPAVAQFGEDLDLCWRAQVAGAKVVVAPSARVRHRQAQVGGERAGWRSSTASRRARGLAEQHRLRTALTCYGLVHLLWIVPLAGIYSVGEALLYAGRRRPADAATTLGALFKALGNPARLLAIRRRTQRQRTIGDREVRRLQSRGNARLRALVRAGLSGAGAGPTLGDDEALALVNDEAAAPSAPVVVETTAGAGAGGRWPAGVAVALLVVFLVGTRQLLGHEIPAIGHLPVTNGGPGRWWDLWWSGWQPDGLGSAAASPPALGLLAAAGTILLGAVGTLQHVLVLGPLLVGPWGAWQAARAFGSRRGRVAALVVYAVVPLPYNALAHGRWAGLLLYAAAPWVLLALARASGDSPFPPMRGRALAVAVGRLAILVALLGAFVPAVLILVPVVAAALLAGAAATGRVRAGVRCLGMGLLGAGLAMILLLPWSAGVVSSATSLFGVGAGPAGRVGLGAVMRFDTGPIGSGALGWAFLAAAALPLVIGRSWRLAWAARCWAVALVCWGLTWAGLRGWLPVAIADPEVLLAPAAAALALSAALGAAAFDTDLPGYRFGWRQLLSAAAAGAVVVAALPVLTAAGEGRWHVPSADASGALLLPDPSAGDYRVLWVGAPSALPLGGWRLENGVAYATSVDGEPNVADLWPPAHAGATPLLAGDLLLARDHDTTELGHLLAPLAVRYIVVPNHDGPSASGASAVPVPTDVLNGLTLQTDLRVLTMDPNYSVYVNAAWAPQKALLPAAAVAAATAGSGPAGGADQQRTDQAVSLQGAHPALVGGGDGSAAGRLPNGGDLYVAATDSGRWQLHTGGRTVGPAKAFGWAMIFPTAGGPASLAVVAPAAARGAMVIEVIVWLMVVVLVVAGGRRTRRSSPGSGRFATKDGAPGPRGAMTTVGVPGPKRAEPPASRAVLSPSAGGLPAPDDEVWADG